MPSRLLLQSAFSPLRRRLFFWFTTWMWPEFESENSSGILGFRLNANLALGCAFVFRNVSNSVDIVFIFCIFCTFGTHMCTLTPHVNLTPPLACLCLSFPLLAYPRNVCVLVGCPSLRAPSLSLSALSGWVHGAQLGLVQRSRQSRGTPPRRKGRHKPQEHCEPTLRETPPR